MITNSGRRCVLNAAAAAGVGALASTATAAQSPAARRTFVLVHGSWHGGWCWRRVADELERRGHKVYTPTLTGLGERSHLISGLVDLNTHITDVVNVVNFENLQDVVLVGHSYAGMVLTGVAEQIRDKIASIIYLDAFLPENGDMLVNLAPEALKAATISARDRGDVSRPPIPAAAFGVNERDQAWVNSKLTPQPLGPSFTSVKATGACEMIAKKTYIRTNFVQPFFDKALLRCRADKTWRTFVLDTGHDVMINQPEELARMLLDAA
jgi:pimeloyl-ACP methyl ester carboxylesterase